MNMHLYSTSGVADPITIVGEPQDAHVTEGELAQFSCSYTGTRDIPLWRINTSWFSHLENYPDRHEYNIATQVLTVSNVHLRDNGTTYQCLVFNLRSRVATLTVFPQGKMNPHTIANQNLQKQMCSLF